MKALKVIGIVIGVLVGLIGLAAFVFWFGWLRAPAPEEICAHLQEIATKEAGTPAPVDPRCPERMKPPEFGRINYVKQVKCVMAAGTLKDVKACDSARRSL
jgi:hypothetical protein